MHGREEGAAGLVEEVEGDFTKGGAGGTGTISAPTARVAAAGVVARVPAEEIMDRGPGIRRQHVLANCIV